MHTVATGKSLLGILHFIIVNHFIQEIGGVRLATGSRAPSESHHGHARKENRCSHFEAGLLVERACGSSQSVSAHHL